MARISQIEKNRIRQSILDVSRTYFFDLGYENTSTKMIAKEVGIAEGTIFNYFPSKTDILFESMYENYIISADEYNQILNVESNITEAIMDYLFKSMNIVMKLPRKIMVELTIQGAKMARKNPERFKKFAEMDYKTMKEIEKYLARLIENGTLKKVDPCQLSEVIFSSAIYELMIYLYDKKIKKETMIQNIKNKLNLIIKGYIKGGNEDEY